MVGSSTGTCGGTPPTRGWHGLNQDIFAGKWKQLRGRVKQTWGDLTDLDRIGGSHDRFIGTLQERYGYSLAEAEKQADSASPREA